MTTSGFRDIRSPRSSEAVTRPARAMTVRLYYLWTLGNDRTTATAFPPLRASLVRAGPAGSAELHGTLHWISIQNVSRGLLISQDFSPRNVPNRHLQGALRTKRFFRTSVPTAMLAPHALSKTTARVRLSPRALALAKSQAAPLPRAILLLFDDRAPRAHRRRHRL